MSLKSVGNNDMDDTTELPPVVVNETRYIQSRSVSSGIALHAVAILMALWTACMTVITIVVIAGT